MAANTDSMGGLSRWCLVAAYAAGEGELPVYRRPRASNRRKGPDTSILLRQ